MKRCHGRDLGQGMCCTGHDGTYHKEGLNKLRGGEG